ncbi:MAG: hypothetical protein ACK5NT_03180 [Pyrinomonadaceae bacterium]
MDNLKNYKGDYPSSEKLFHSSVIDKACFLEIAKQEYLNDLDIIPEWLHKNAEKKPLFDRFVQEDNLSSVWLTLNSMNHKGMTLSQIAEGLETLKSKTDDSTYHLIADNWIEGWRNSTHYKS